MLKQFNSAKLLDDIQDARTKLKLDLPNANQVRDIDSRLSALLTLSIGDRNDLDSQSSNLFEIVEASNRIAADQSYPKPNSTNSSDDKAEDDLDTKPVHQKWLNYYGSLIKTKELQRRLLADVGEDNDGDDDGKIGNEFHRSIQFCVSRLSRDDS